MIDLKNKLVLFIAPSFFGYEESIKKRLLELGANVDYFDERPANNFWSKAFLRLNRRFLSFDINEHYKSIYGNVKKKIYDYVFIINIEAMPYWFLERLKENNPGCQFILYMWDSIQNKKNTINYFSFFNIIYSFDENDSEKYSEIKFLPLFFLNEYKEIADYKDFEYDLAFVGTAHSDRFLLIQKIREQIETNKLISYWFLYLQNWKLFIWNKLNNRSFKDARFRDFHYKALSKWDTFDLIKKTRIILDIQHPNQVGLTMRTIEMLGAKRKLITTNRNVENYDFYSPNNILVIDRNDPQIPADFYFSEYEPVNDELYFRYSLDGWLKNIFSLHNNYN